MAREQITRITSDLTGIAYEGSDVPPVKVTFGEVKGTLDLAPADIEALTAFVNGDAAPLRKLILATAAPVTAGKSKSKSGSKSRSAADEANQAIRAWWGTDAGRAALGVPADFVIPTRGRIPDDVREAYGKRAA